MVAGAVTTTVVGVGSAALALNGLRARTDAVATAPAPATMAIFLTRLRIMFPPERTAVSPRHLAESVRDRRCRGHDRLCRAIPTGGPTATQIFAVIRAATPRSASTRRGRH